MDGNPFLLAAAPVVGFAAGFVNTLAGMGSLLTLPLLILLGLPANVANGTNRVGVVAQNIIAVTTFRRRGALDVEGSLGLTAASVVGAIAGAALAVDLDETLLRRTIGVLMLVMLAIMLLRPDRFIEARAGAWSLPKWARIALFVAIGAYGGFIQAGVGIFLVAGMVLGGGFGLVRANAIKNLIVLLLSIAALPVFVANAQVRWDLGLLIALGQGAGAWVAAHLAVTRGARFVHAVLIVVLVFSSAALILDVGR